MSYKQGNLKEESRTLNIKEFDFLVWNSPDPKIRNMGGNALFLPFLKVHVRHLLGQITIFVKPFLQPDNDFSLLKWFFYFFLDDGISLTSTHDKRSVIQRRVE